MPAPRWCRACRRDGRRARLRPCRGRGRAGSSHTSAARPSKQKEATAWPPHPTREHRIPIAATVAERLPRLVDTREANGCVMRRRPGARMAPMTTVPERLQPLLDPASPVQQVARRLVDAGYECFLVGGTVRDALLGRTRAGRRRVRLRDERPARGGRGARARVGRPRCGSRASASGPSASSATACRWRSPRSAPRSTAPRAASPRSSTPTTSRPTSRDATSPSTRWRSGFPNPSLIDPYGGAADLAARRLRTPLEPEVSFLDDPLRMLRAARFIADFDLVPDPALVQAVGELRPPARDRQRGANPRRALEAPARRRPERGAVVPRGDRPLRRVPPRARAP